MVAPSENSSSIESYLDHLKIDSNPSYDLYESTSCVIMTNEGYTLVKVASLILDYNHSLCSFHMNQLAVRVSFLSFLYGYTFSMWVHFMLYIYLISLRGR